MKYRTLTLSVLAASLMLTGPSFAHETKKDAMMKEEMMKKEAMKKEEMMKMEAMKKEEMMKKEAMIPRTVFVMRSFPRPRWPCFLPFMRCKLWRHPLRHGVTISFHT